MYIYIYIYIIYPFLLDTGNTISLYFVSLSEAQPKGDVLEEHTSRKQKQNSSRSRGLAITEV